MAQVKITIRPNGPYRVEAPEGSIELVDANGALLAGSDNSLVEQNNPGLLTGAAKPLGIGFGGLHLASGVYLARRVPA